MYNKTYKLFLYGSLRKGMPLNYMLRSVQNKGEKGLTKELFSLYSIGDRYPCLVKSPNERVVGEVVEVDEKTYNYISEMEKSAGYHTEEIIVIVRGQEVVVECYMMTEDKAKWRVDGLVNGGDWVPYFNEKDKERQLQYN